MPLQRTRAARSKAGVTDPSKRRAPKQEKDTAKALGGRIVRGSGSGREKGDARVEGVVRIEAKCTRNKSFSVTREMWDKIETAASTCVPSEVPAIHIEFLDADGNRVNGLYVVREDDFEQLITEGPNAGATEHVARPRGAKLPTRRG